MLFQFWAHGSSKALSNTPTHFSLTWMRSGIGDRRYFFECTPIGLACLPGYLGDPAWHSWSSFTDIDKEDDNQVCTAEEREIQSSTQMGEKWMEDN